MVLRSRKIEIKNVGRFANLLNILFIDIRDFREDFKILSFFENIFISINSGFIIRNFFGGNTTLIMSTIKASDAIKPGLNLSVNENCFLCKQELY